MQLKIYKDYHEMSSHAADEIIDLIKLNPSAVVCLASGDTPRLMCNLLVEKATAEKADFSKCSFIGLDEWVGIPPQNEGSCHYFFQSLVFAPLKISKEQIHLFDGLSDNPAKECEAMDKLILEKGGIDLMIVGVGMNGHIGFNEPGVSFDNYSHVIELDETTVSVGQKYFKEPAVLKQGITLGLKYLQQAANTIMLANGIKKAAIIKKALQEEVTNIIPASIIQTLPQAMVMIDEEAASLLK